MKVAGIKLKPVAFVTTPPSIGYGSSVYVITVKLLDIGWVDPGFKRLLNLRLIYYPDEQDELHLLLI
jgi:hypothetical protein